LGDGGCILEEMETVEGWCGLEMDAKRLLELPIEMIAQRLVKVHHGRLVRKALMYKCLCWASSDKKRKKDTTQPLEE